MGRRVHPTSLRDKTPPLTPDYYERVGWAPCREDATASLLSVKGRRAAGCLFTAKLPPPRSNDM
jgi:hypothetical protein